MPAQRIKRRVVLEESDETGDISHKLPKWHSISAQFNCKEDSILDVNSPYQPSTFYIHRKECIQSRCDRQWNRVRGRCNLAKATISYKVSFFLPLSLETCLHLMSCLFIVLACVSFKTSTTVAIPHSSKRFPLKL